MGGRHHAGDEVSRLLYDAWIGGPGGDRAKTLADRIPVPGTVGLRGRFHFLTDAEVPALPDGQFQLSWETWQRQVELTAVVSRYRFGLDGMARPAAASGDVAAETRARVDAVLAIEAMRSSQERHQYQQEYRERFAMVYSAAIRAAVRNDDPPAFITVFENLAGRRLAGMLEQIPATAAAQDAQLAAHVLATASNLPLDGGDLASNTASAERRARLIGRLALRGGMPEPAERAFADVAAALYRSFSPDDAGPLLNRAARHSDLLLVTLVPAALLAMTRRFLADPGHRDGHLSRWAPLITVGTV